MPLIYRHTCNMVDKTHRNFAFAQPFSIYLTSSLFFSLLSSECVLRCHHPNTIPHRSAKIATNTRKWRKELSRQRREEKKTHTQPTTTMTHGFENAKSMCPLCLYAIQLYGNEQINKKIHCPNILTLPLTQRHSNQAEKNERKQWMIKRSPSPEKCESKNGKGIYFISSIWQTFLCLLILCHCCRFAFFSLVILTHTE